MPLYLTLSRGPRADSAEPILASSDPAVIRAVLAAIGSLSDPVPRTCLGDEAAEAVRLLPRRSSGDGHDR
jgi:hypothetical protein